MSLSETRTKLLAQHEAIRCDIAEALKACTAQPADHEQLQALLGRLVTSVHLHNLAEEQALRTVLPTLDKFGEVRKEVMLSDHLTEHEDIQAALVAASEGAKAGQDIPALLDRMLAHMEHEENLFLSADVLK